MSHTLDCTGLQCPEPVIRSKALLTNEHPTDVVVLVDNAASLENVTRFWQKNGYTVSQTQEDGNRWRISARGTGEYTEIVDTPITNCPTDTPAKTLVFITTETLGRGDDTLGAKLMANFLGSLPELGSALWRIVLVNGGVKLTATEGNALENLKKLADQGVSILVCGTCLEHYGLLQKKQVGETTNMMDIVTSLSLATKVIRP